MRKLIYSLIGIILSVLIIGFLFNKVPKVLIPNLNSNIDYLESMDVDDYIDVSDVITMMGYKVHSVDVDERVSNNIFSYGRSNPMYYITINTSEMKDEYEEKASSEEKETDQLEEEGSSQPPRRDNYYVYPYSGGAEYFKDLTPDSKLITLLSDYNRQFSNLNGEKSLGFNKLNGDIKEVDVSPILNKIKDAKLPLDREHLNISSTFGVRVNPVNYEEQQIKEIRRMPFHTGLDLFSLNVKSSNVYSMFDGTITKVEESNKGYGNLVVLDHGGFTTYYAHLQSLPEGLKVGKKLKAGDIIGPAGNSGFSTGPHLHVEMNIGDVSVNPEIFVKAIIKNVDGENMDIRKTTDTKIPTIENTYKPDKKSPKYSPVKTKKTSKKPANKSKLKNISPEAVEKNEEELIEVSDDKSFEIIKDRERLDGINKDGLEEFKKRLEEETNEQRRKK